ncbi:ABC transporter substrate-binding protein [Proteinivorax tanatarense]|uniref:ABC transporter substrate-binding protein n=1 Tax=Proteinivorax tanatarense TaxID=1260629 RepID=A0AAU7VP92_9FIRM
MKKSLLVILVVCMVFSIVGCGSEDVVNEGDDDLRIIRIDDSNLGYPSVYTVSPRGRGYLLMSFIFDTLTWKDENGVVPMLAEDWSVSEDQKVWTFELVDNAQFTDGEPLTAEDVKFSYYYMMEHPHQWVNLNMIEQVEAVGEHTVEITLKEIYAPFITDIAGNVPIMPKHIWEDIQEPEKFNSEEAVIGSGPFTLKHYDKNVGHYIFEANKDYFMGEPVIDKLKISDNSQPSLALQNNELDAAQHIRYGEAMELKEESDFEVLEGPGGWVYRMYFNFDNDVLNNKKVRQAIYYAIDLDDFVERSLRGGGMAGNPGHIHPESAWYYDHGIDYEQDVEKAKKLLKESGVIEEGEELEFELLVRDSYVDEAEMIQGYLGEIGINLNIKPMDQNSVDSLINEGKFEIALNGHGAFAGDPVLLARFIGDDVDLGSTPAVTSQGGESWNNHKFNEIFVDQLRELDEEKRYEKVAELQKIIAEELPTLTLYYRKSTFAYNPNKLEGWFYTKDGVAISVPTIQNKLIYINGTWMGE